MKKTYVKAAAKPREHLQVATATVPVSGAVF
mgnify:FL=1